MTPSSQGLEPATFPERFNLFDDLDLALDAVRAWEQSRTAPPDGVKLSLDAPERIEDP
jgi:hypothetical protein